jgi:hypothetical protein
MIEYLFLSNEVPVSTDIFFLGLFLLGLRCSARIEIFLQKGVPAGREMFLKANIVPDHD